MSKKAQLDFEGLTNALTTNIARNEELFEQFAKLLDLTEDEFEYFLDNLVGHENVTADTDRL